MESKMGPVLEKVRDDLKVIWGGAKLFINTKRWL